MTDNTEERALIERRLDVLRGAFRDVYNSTADYPGKIKQGYAFTDTFNLILESLKSSPRPAAFAAQSPTAGDGWVYFNPDAGEEYARQHPVESGGVPDATNIRRSTGQEDHLWSEINRLRFFTPNTAGEAIPEGMVPWAGGDSAPEDWDGGEVFLRKGYQFDPFGQPVFAVRWKHDAENKDTDIIAYTPRPAATPKAPAPSPVAGKADAEVERILALTDEQVLAEANADDVAWARGFKQGLNMGHKVSRFDKRIKELTDEAIRESLADISAEFERRFGPPVADRRPDQQIEQICREMEYAVAGGMAWISYDEATDFCRRLRSLQVLRPNETPVAGDHREEIARASTWLRACSTWLLENDLDMTMPDGVLDTDPLDIADRLDALLSPSHEAGAAGKAPTGENEALARALCLLDTFAGEGLAHTYGNGQELDAAEVCAELAGEYGIEPNAGWWRTVAALSTPPDPAIAVMVARLREALSECADVIELFKKPELLAEGVHVGLRKGTDAEDAHSLWTAIGNSTTSAWGDAISFAIDPYFSMWGGDAALQKARSLLAAFDGQKLDSMGAGK